METRLKLSKNFYLSEFIQSQIASRLGIVNNPESRNIIALQALVTAILQPVRDEINAAIVITSGYRNDALNKAVGGSDESQHLKGEAADVTSPQGILNIVDAVRELGLDFDQMLIYPQRGFIHLSYKRCGNNRGFIKWM